MNKAFVCRSNLCKLLTDYKFHDSKCKRSVKCFFFVVFCVFVYVCISAQCRGADTVSKWVHALSTEATLCLCLCLSVSLSFFVSVFVPAPKWVHALSTEETLCLCLCLSVSLSFLYLSSSQHQNGFMHSLQRRDGFIRSRPQDPSPLNKLHCSGTIIA